MAKRKLEEDVEGSDTDLQIMRKKSKTDEAPVDELIAKFRTGLFDQDEVARHRLQYSNSQPYVFLLLFSQDANLN